MKSPIQFVKVGVEVLSNIVFTFTMIPFGIRSLWYYKRSPMLARSLRYSDQLRHVLDVHIPKGGHSPFPVVIFVHGGAWGFGNKFQYTLFGARLAAHANCLAVVCNYRLYPEGKIREMTQDIFDVIRWTRDNIHKYGGDPDRIYLCGHSAGAHLISLTVIQHQIATANPHDPSPLSSIFTSPELVEPPSSPTGGPTETRDLLGDIRTEKEQLSSAETMDPLHFAEGLESGVFEKDPLHWILNEHGTGKVVVSEHHEATGAHSGETQTKILEGIKGIVAISGVYDIADHYLHETKRGLQDVSPMKPTMMGPANFDLYSPTKLVEKLADSRAPVVLPPFYVFHGTKDGTVPMTSSEKFCSALDRAGFEYEMFAFDGCGHSEMAIDFMNRKSPIFPLLLEKMLSIIQ